MVRYMNVTREGLRVGKKPLKRCIGRVETPNYNIAINIVAYVYEYFMRAGLIEWRDGDFRLTSNGFKEMCRRK